MVDSATLRKVASELEEIVPEVKVHLLGGGGNSRVEKAGLDASVRSNQVSGDDYATAFTNLGALDPVYDPEMLALIFEHSNSLRQNVDSYATNIDGFGHRFDPIIKTDSPDALVKVSHAMHMDRLRLSPNAKPPTPDEAQAELDKIKLEMEIEKSRLKHFFEFCCPDMSFVTLRRQTRQDLEVTGNAYWEVLRNNRGEIARFVYVPSFTVRLLPLDPGLVKTKQNIRVSDLSLEEITVNSRLRRYVQIAEARQAFFKELGDPRIVSAATGMAFKDVEAMKEAEPNALQATELLHFRIHSPRSPYGVPRWIGNLLAVIGSRQSEEVNFNYFENKSVPPLAILVSGGRMTKDSVTRVTDYVDTYIKGKRNFHRILVLEADAGDGKTASETNSSKMKIDIKPLTGAQQQDALFQNYDERNIDKVGQSFRLPRMLRGDIRDFNRATSDAALVFAEVQVFEPERQEFDFVLNRKILSSMGIRFWKLVSMAPVIRDPVSMSEIIKNLSNANVLTPEESRELAGDVFNKTFAKLNAAWTKQPGALTIAGIPVESGAPTQPSDPNFSTGDEVVPDKPEPLGVEASAKQKVTKSLAREAARLIKLKEVFETMEEDTWKAYLQEQARQPQG